MTHQSPGMGETIPEPEMVKVWVPGERPWAEVLSRNADGTMVVRLANKLAGDYTAAEFSEMLAKLVDAPVLPGDHRKHSYRFNDVVIVKANPELSLWEVTGYATTN